MSTVQQPCYVAYTQLMSVHYSNWQEVFSPDWLLWCSMLCCLIILHMHCSHGWMTLV